MLPPTLETIKLYNDYPGRGGVSHFAFPMLWGMSVNEKDCFHTLRASVGRSRDWRVWKGSVVLNRYGVGGPMWIESSGS